MANSIVSVNVSVVVAPTPATLQKCGAFVSMGGTTTTPGISSYLTQLSDLTPLLPNPAAITSITWSGGVATVTTAVPHNLPNGQIVKVQIASAVPSGYNGNFLATVTGASTFTYSLLTSPGASPATTPGTWLNYSAVELVQMATTFFAQGASQGAFVLELGPSNVTTGVANLTNYLTANPNSNYTPGALNFFYSYEVPRSWDANSAFLTLLQAYESPTSKTYFFITTTLATYQNYNSLEKCVITLIEAPVYGVYPANALTAISYSGGVVTGTTTTAHGVVPGEWFTISGCTPAGYNGTWLAQPGTTGSTLVYNIPTALGVETVLGTLVASLYTSAGVAATEFSMSSLFHASLNYAPSTTNKVTPFAFTYVFGVTPFPTQGQQALLATLKAAATNIIGTGAEGGISNTIVLWGTTEDANDFTYWYSVDWVQINLDLDTANAVINGSNNPINPLYLNQPGIDYLQAVAASTMARGISFGLVNGVVVQTALDGTVLAENIDQGLYDNQTVVNAVPFVTYYTENPGDYKFGKYAGFSVVYTPNRGFNNIVYNVVVTELIAQ